MSKAAILNSSRTDWERIKNRPATEIDTSDVAPVTEELLTQARLRPSAPGPHSFRVFRVDNATGEEITVSEWQGEITETSTTPLLVALEVETLAWFAAQGDEAQNKMRAALRIYAQAHQ